MKIKKVKIFKKYTFYYLANDKYVGQRVAVEKYEPYETQLILRQLKKDGVVVDVGANIGYYTILMADKVKKIYAFEPDKISFEILKKNIAANKLKNVTAINAAVGSKEEIKNLYKSKENLGDHKLYKTQKQEFLQKEAVEVIKLDNYLKDEKIEMIKIDTQGWEPEVIEGAKNIIKKDSPVIFLEYSPSSYKLAGLDGKKMINNLGKIYHKIWWIDEWLYVYKRLSQEKIDKICATNKTGYADLWMKKEFSGNDWWQAKKNFRFRQWVKQKLKL